MLKSMKNSMLVKMLVLAAIIVSPVTNHLTFAKSAPATPTAAARNYWLYNVRIQGYASGRYFTSTGQLMVTDTINSAGTTNGANPRDLVLVSGSPLTGQEAGAIQFATNTFLLDGPAQLDMAYVSYDSRNYRLTIQPDSRIAATGRNYFNVTSGFLADFYQIRSGTMRVQLSSNMQSLTGQIDFTGNGYIYPSAGSYRATVTGTLARRGTF